LTAVAVLDDERRGSERRPRARRARSSIRATVRMTGVAKNTVAKLASQVMCGASRKS